MTTATFKTSLKKVSSQLKGVTLQLVSGRNVTPFQSLRDFGYAILNEESKGNLVSVTKAWANTGTVEVKSFEQLAALLSTGNVSGVQFMSFYQPVDFADYLKTSFGTTE